MHFIAQGIKIKPEEIIRNEATCNAESPIRPCLINMKLLPQIIERSIKMNQLKAAVFFKLKICAKVRNK